MAKGFNIVDYVLAQAADSPVKKFDGGGGVDGSGSRAGAPWQAPIAYANPSNYQSNYTYSGPYMGNVTQGVNYQGGSGGGSRGVSTATNQDKLASVTMGQADTLRPLIPPPTAQEIRDKEVARALIKLSNAVADARAFDKGTSGLTTEQKQQAVTDAREEIETLGVTRDEIANFNTNNSTVMTPAGPVSTGIETISPRIVDGNFLDRTGDFVSDAFGTVVDKYGTGALQVADAYLDLFGLGSDDLDSPLDRDIAVAFNPLAPGATYVLGEDGKVATTNLGTTSGGNPVVLGGPIGAMGSVFGGYMEGDMGVKDIPAAVLDAVGGLGGLAQTAATGALNAAETKAPSAANPVKIDTAGVAGSLLGNNDDKTKIDSAATGTSNDASAVAATPIPIKDAPSVSIDRPNSATPIKDAPSVSIARPDSTAQDLDVAEIIRTNAGTDVGLLVDTNQVKTQPEVKVPASSSSAASGGNNPSAGGGGISEVAGEPGELVDIDYLFDVGGDSIFAPEILEEDEDELLYPYRGGGAVKRFSGTAGSAVSAYPPASLVPEEDGGTMKTGKNIFQKGLPALIGAGLGAAFGLTDKDDPNPSGYQGGIPEYKYNRSLVPDAFSTTNVDGTPRRPGSAGRSYFTQGAYDPIMETVDGVEVQSTLGGAQRRADAVDAATQQATQDALYQQIYDDFVALQPGDDTPGSGSMEAAAAGMGATQDATPAPAPAPTPISATPTGGGTPIPSDITFSPDVTAEDFAIGAATGPVQQPTTDVFSAYDAVVNQYNPDAITYDSGDINSVISAITGNNVGTADVAQDFGISESAVWGSLLRQGAYTPAGLASYIATNSNQPDYTEVDLIVRLLEDGQTSAEEVLAYYQQTDPEQFGNTTLAEVKEYFTQLGGTRTLAQGGMLQGNGYYLGGTTDGMADEVPATIDNSQPAALSDGEFVVPADVVSHLGNGNSEAGATQLYSMMDRVRKKRTGTVKQGTEINPMQQLPA